MKTLLIMRHAKSSWKDSGLSDFERPLNTRGRKAAPMMGRHLRTAGYFPELVLTSSAERARQTAEAVVKAASFDATLRHTRALYLAGPDDIRAQLQALPRDVDCVLVVGHNPGLEELLRSLSGESEFLPTAAVAVVELPIESWSDLAFDGACCLAHLWRPKELLDA